MPGLLARPASGTWVRTRSPPRDATPGPTRAYTTVCEKLVCTYAPQPEVQKPPLPRSKLQKGYGEHSPRALRSESPPRSRKEAAGLAEMRGQARGRQVRGFRAPSCPPWVLSSRFHSPLGGSGPAWSSCPAQGAGHRRERVRSTPAPLPATWAQPSLIVTNLSAPSSLIGPIAARGNYLCTRLVGAPAAPPAPKSESRGDCGPGSWSGSGSARPPGARTARGVCFSRRGPPGPGVLSLGFFFFLKGRGS